MATESPIFVESFSNQFTQSFRATAANGLQHFPATFETVWDPSDLPPPLPPAGLSPNGAPASNVQLAVVTLQPGPLANTFQFLAATPPVPLPPPLLVAAIDRVIPNTWGAQALIPGAYQQGVTDASGTAVPYAETKWVVDGVNRFLEFPYGTPAGFLAGSSAPTLRFYRYTGGIAGGGGGGGGTVVGGANLGGGARVFDDFASGATLFFRTLVAGAGIAVVEDVFPGEITISRQPPPDNVDLYVSAFGDDALGNGTASLPYQTLQRAFLDIRNSGWNDTAFVNIATTFLPLTIAGQVDLNVGSLGAQAHDVVVRGEPRAFSLSDTVTSVQVDPTSTLLTIGGSAPYPTFFAGSLVRFTSGPLAAYTIDAAPAAIVQAEAFIGAVDFAGRLVLAFAASGGSPNPGDTFIIEELVTQVELSGVAVLDAGAGRSLVFRDLIFRSPPGVPSFLGYKDFALQMFASALLTEPGGTLLLANIGGSFVASTQGQNSTTVPSTAGVAALSAGGTFRRSGYSTVPDAVAGSIFLGDCQYGGSFALRGSYAATPAGGGIVFAANRGPSSVDTCQFECEGGSVPDGLAILWASNSTGLQVDAVRSSGGASSAVLYATEGGLIRVGLADITGCQTALLAGLDGTISSTGGGSVAGGGSGAVAMVMEGGALTVAGSLSVAAGPGSSAVSIRAGAMTVRGDLIATAVDADGIALEGGATLCSGRITASHSAPAPGLAGVRLREGSRIVTRDLSVPGGASGVGVSVESESSLQASGGLSIAASGTALFVRRGWVTCDSFSAGPGANVGADLIDGFLRAGSLFCQNCIAVGLRAEKSKVAISGALAAAGCGGASVFAVNSTVLVGGALQAQDSPVGIDLRGCELAAGDIFAETPVIGGGQGLVLASSSVKVVQVAGVSGGVLTASLLGAGRLNGILATDSTIEATQVLAIGCAGGSGVDLVGSALAAVDLNCNNAANIGVRADKSRIVVAEGASANACASAGLSAVFSTILVGGILQARDSSAGVELWGSDLSAREIYADAPGGSGGVGLSLTSSSVKIDTRTSGPLVASTSSSRRDFGIQAVAGSTITANDILAAEAAGGDCVVLTGSTLVAATLTCFGATANGIVLNESALTASSLNCDNCAGNGVQAENSRIAVTGATVYRCGNSGLRATASTVLIRGTLLAQDSIAGVNLLGSQLTAGDILADGPGGIWGLRLVASSVKVGVAGTSSGVLTVSTSGAARGVGIEAEDSTIEAVEVIATDSLTDGVVLRGSTLRARLIANSNPAAGVIAAYGSALHLKEKSAVEGNRADGVAVSINSECIAQRANINRNGLNGILLENCSQAYLQNDVGSTAPNGAHGLAVRYGSKAVAERALSLTGAAGDVELGTSGTVTWAALSGQAPATATDLFNLQTQQCGVYVG